MTRPPPVAADGAHGPRAAVPAGSTPAWGTSPRPAGGLGGSGLERDPDVGLRRVRLRDERGPAGAVVRAGAACDRERDVLGPAREADHPDGRQRALRQRLLDGAQTLCADDRADAAVAPGVVAADRRADAEAIALARSVVRAEADGPLVLLDQVQRRRERALRRSGRGDQRHGNDGNGTGSKGERNAAHEVPLSWNRCLSSEAVLSLTSPSAVVAQP